MMSESVEQKCGIPENWTFHWVIDEFDSTFDTLAMASIRYHMGHAVTLCEGEWREQLQSMLEEFEEINSRWTMSAEFMAHVDSHESDATDPLQVNCAECDRHAEVARVADKKLDEDRQAARHKFVDLMPGLWS